MKVSLGLDDDPQLGDERGGRPSGGFNHRLLCDQLTEFSAFRAITQIAENSPVFQAKPIMSGSTLIKKFHPLSTLRHCPNRAMFGWELVTLGLGRVSDDDSCNHNHKSSP